MYVDDASKIIQQATKAHDFLWYAKLRVNTLNVSSVYTSIFNKMRARLRGSSNLSTFYQINRT